MKLASQSLEHDTILPKKVRISSWPKLKSHIDYSCWSIKVHMCSWKCRSLDWSHGKFVWNNVPRLRNLSSNKFFHLKRNALVTQGNKALHETFRADVPVIYAKNRKYFEKTFTRTTYGEALISESRWAESMSSAQVFEGIYLHGAPEYFGADH